jgi:stage IV sporulation protein FB
MLGHAEPTPYDLRFTLFGIPVRVHPLFWVAAALLGWDGDHLELTLLWILCEFISILVHEFGHALAAKSFGWRSEVVLYMMGGYAQPYITWGNSTARRVLMTFAGPGAGFILYAIVSGVELLLGHFQVEVSVLAFAAIYYLKFINLWWGLINLLPVYPLDGGQISADLFAHYRRHDGHEIALKLSMAVGVLVAIYGYHEGNRMMTIMFGMLAYTNFQQLQSGGRYR